MANTILVSPHLSDAATLTAGDEVTQLEGANLLTMDPTEKWRADTLANAYVDLDFGAAVAIRFVFLGYTNGRSATNLRVAAADSQANLESTGYDSGSSTALWPNGSDLSDFDEPHGWHYLSSAQTFRWCRTRMIDATHPDGYLQAGRLIIGIESESFFQPTQNPDRVLEITPAREASVAVKSSGGGTTVRQRTRYRDLAWTWDNLTEAEALGVLAPILRKVGTSGDVVGILDPEEATYPMDKTAHGLLKSPSLPHVGTYSSSPRYVFTADIEGL